MGPWNRLSDTLAREILTRVRPLAHHDHVAVTAIPRRWLTAVPGMNPDTLRALNRAAAETVARDPRAQEACDRIRRGLVAFDLGAVATDQLGLRRDIVATLEQAGFAELDQIMRTPDAVLAGIDGLGAVSIRHLRWARILCPLGSVLACRRNELASQHEWDAAEPATPARARPTPYDMRLHA